MKIVVFKNGARGDSVCEALRDEHDLLTFEPSPVNKPDFVEMLAEWEPDLGICAGYPVILKKKILGVPKRGWWNCHGGPVPEYRGGSPLNWQIIDGKETIGVTLLVMDEGLDTGPVISRASFLLGRHETIKEAHERANMHFARMVKEAVDKGGRLMTKKQPKSDIVRKQRNDEMGELNLHWPQERIRNFVRALTHPYPGAWIRTKNGKMRIWSASVD